MRGPVRGAEIHAGRAAAEAERRRGDVRRPGVRDADPALDAGGHLRLAGEDVRQEAVKVGDAAGGRDPLCERPDGLVAVGRSQVQIDEVDGDQVFHWGGHDNSRTRLYPIISGSVPPPGLDSTAPCRPTA
ncbi:hypothetical protein GCM10022255_008740 [Dactylosporangium darangshiense]|uniref:Uncharacterized protein n=1 Tax=Dactylosporangium darangshiense TaxID=579108 RepID=A0ABP8CXS9_9ACTN